MAVSEYFNQLFSLEGKTALVTGGSRGIGLMIAEALVNAGATVYISSRTKEVCDAVATKLSQKGTCISLPYDLSLVENIESLVKDISNAGRGLNILVNNSGASWGAPFEEYPEKAWEKVLNLNVVSPFYLVQKCLPLLRASGNKNEPSKVINIGSVSAIVSDPINAYAYVSSKAAIHQLTRGLAKDLVKDHINVNAIAPGYFPSKMTSHIVDNENVKQKVLAAIPMGRLGQPKDIGSLSIFLSSNASNYMTGNIIPIDGGIAVGY